MAQPSENETDDMSGAAESGAQGFAIVGIGASAGGLQAYTEFLQALPADTGMAFVLVMHLDPHHESKLAEILSRSAPLPVVEVHDEPLVEPNHIYVIPPNRSMVIRKRHLRLAPRATDASQYKPIDAFLRSLAADQGPLGIAVILSGMGSDGTLGLSEIKAQGGLTFAQDRTAAYSPMPQSTVATGDVDLVLPPAKIAEELARISKYKHLLPAHVPAEEEVTIGRILRLLQSTTGVDFAQYKPTMLFRRISRRMLLKGYDDLEEYLQILKGNPAEVELLYRDFLISVTSFFRDSESFAALKKYVIPRIMANRSRQDPVRVWILGCSTGEEAYSIAIALREYGQEHSQQFPIQLFATDLNEHAIEAARQGLYPKSIAQDLSADRLRRFFVETDEGYRIVKSIRDVCVFAKQNVLTDPPFSRMDLISCRNLLIYMEPVLQQKVIPMFHYALNKNGYLWLGSSESVAQFPTLFETIDSKHKLYAKKPNGQAHRLAVPLVAPPRERVHVDRDKLELHLSTTGVPDVQREADRLALAKYAPPGVLVNADYEILQFRGDTSYYLAPPSGKPNLNVLKMARDGLLVSLRSALQQADQEDLPVRSEGLRIKSNGGFREVNLEVIRVGARGARSRCFLVLFEDAYWRRRLETAPQLHEYQPPDDSSPEGGEDAAEQVVRLKQELQATREYLQSLLEQQEAANEELQSANEEIQSSNEELQSINEELQTTKEEIQSSNEELTTVNEELAERNLELQQANNDLVNFLNSAQLVLLMLGSDMRIRWFTPQAERLLNLITTDVGRPIGDIRLPIDAPDLERMLGEVMQTLAAKHLEVRDKHGHWYSLQVRPYKTTENKIDGAVVALIDIDPLQRAKDELEKSNRHKDEFLAMLAHELRNPLAPLRSQLEVLRGGMDGVDLSQAVNMMYRQVEQLTRLVDDLLDAARINEGRIDLKFEPVDLVTVIANVIDATRNAMEQRGHKFAADMSPESVWVNGDPMRLEQAITNLVNNAIKYTDDKGEILLVLKQEAGQAIVRCCDTGIGISKEMLPRVFNLFVQSDVSYSRDRGGLGIGLALVKQIVELHGGTVEAGSNGAGKGSTFTLRLPVLKDKQVPQSAPPESPHGATLPLKVLIVDDNVGATRTLSILLKRMDHEVKTANDGHSALELLETFTPDVAVLDIGLPGMDGCELAQEIRMRPRLADIYLIALTGYSQESDQKRFREAGFNDHLVKPAGIDELQKVLKKVRRGGS